MNNTCLLCQGYIVNNTCIDCSIGCINCDIKGCITCKNDYYLVNNSCIECVDGTVINNFCKIPCQDSCIECTNNICSICNNNSVLLNGKCECSIGYEGSNCTQKELKLEILVNQDNIIFI